MSEGRGAVDDVWLERRRWARVPYAGPVLVASPEAVRTCPARDLSGGGAFLLADGQPAVGSPVRVEFELGRRGRFALMAKVVRVEVEAANPGRGGFAVRFEAPEDVCAEVALALATNG